MSAPKDDVCAAIEARDAAVLAGRHTANRDLADVLRREIEASSVAEVARRAGWSRTTIYSMLESYPEESKADEIVITADEILQAAKRIKQEREESI